MREIISGNARIMIAKDTKGEPLGYALPGGEITKEVERAAQMAWLINENYRSWENWVKRRKAQ